MWRLLVLLLMCSYTPRAAAQSVKDDGYRGVWYSISQGGKTAYSGGLGTYPPHIKPMAIYVPSQKKTFFVYGGSAKDNNRHLRIMASYYDHEKGTLPRPTQVRDCGNFTDAHANPSVCIDSHGHLLVFAAARGKFPGKIYRSAKPYDIEAFEEVREGYPYPQPSWVEGKGMFFLYTKYTGGRENYFRTAPDGVTFSDEVQMTEQGHYPSSFVAGGKILLASDWHRQSSDNRTNLYFWQSADFGKTWTTVDGKPLKLPLAFPKNDALVRDYHAENKFVFLNDVKVDKAGRPLVLYVVSNSGAYGPGKVGGPRSWTLARWTGEQWTFSNIAEVDHNYDYGNLHVEADGTLVAIGPTSPGPHADWCGGEMVTHISKDEGKTWRVEKELTRKSERNHTFARIPLNVENGFFAMWMDGDPTKESTVDLYFTTRAGEVYRMPRKMAAESERPERMK